MFIDKSVPLGFYARALENLLVVELP